jgi:hypothetical protein
MADVKPPKGSAPDVEGRSVQFYTAVLKAVGAPATETNLNLLKAWQASEGGTAAYNPFNTTRDSKAQGQSNYNTFGSGYHVRNYPNFQVGVATTVATLRNYPGVIAGLKIQDPVTFTSALVNSVWDGGYGAPGKRGSRDYRQSNVWQQYQRISGKGGAGTSTAGAGNAQAAGYQAQDVWNPFTTGKEAAALLRILGDGQFWIRVLEMLAGTVACAYGVVILATGEANIDWQKIAGLVATKGKSAAASAASEGSTA